MPVPIPPGEGTEVPYGSFAFHVAFEGTGGAFAPFGTADAGVIGGFSDVSGLEAMMEHKVIKAGGHNYGPMVRAGPVSFGTVVLKRGIVRARPLWSWWSVFAGASGTRDGLPTPANRCSLLIALIDPVSSGSAAPAPAAGGTAAPPARVGSVAWRLRNAMPVKFRIGDLNAKGGEIAVEEIHLVHEGLDFAGGGA